MKIPSAVPTWALYVAGGAALLFLLDSRRMVKAIAGATGDVAAGAVVGAGEVIGIPATDPEKCAAAGNLLERSFYCDAAEFIFGPWQRLLNKDAPIKYPAPSRTVLEAPGGGFIDPLNPICDLLTGSGCSWDQLSAGVGIYTDPIEFSSTYGKEIVPIGGLRG